MLPSKNQQTYIWIIFFAFTLRIIWATAVPVVPVSDSAAYDTFALNLVNCQNYGWNCTEESAYWPVGTSFIYSLIYKIFGHTYWSIALLNIGVSLTTIWLTMFLAELWFSSKVAVLSGLFLAFWPSQIQMTTILASELIFNVLVVAALACWCSEGWNLGIRSVLTGIFVTAATYVRPTALLIPILLLFIRYITTRQIVRSIAAVVVMLVLMGILIAPWSIRNYDVFGQFVLISTNGGANLWMGNNPQSTDGYMKLPSGLKKMNEAERDDYLKNQAKDYIKEKPLVFFKRFFRRIISTHSRESISISWNEVGLVSRYGENILGPLKLLNFFYWIVMLLLALLGAIQLWREVGLLYTIAHPTVLFWAYYTTIHGVTVSMDRYHFPSIPMIAVLAGYAAFFLIRNPERAS